MKPLHWYPKPFTPGDIDGEGARKLLGRPSLHPLATLVRETAQNSWDAALKGEQLVYQLSLRTLTGAQRQVLTDVVFAEPGQGTDLSTFLERKELVVLEIHDRGTVGLGGPVRNDLLIEDGQTTDYIDFVLNVGAPRDTHLGGGTYGFGKTITYLLSEVDTTIIWSRPADGGINGTRFVASAMGDAFEWGYRRYTGRQWWGVEPDIGDGIRPLEGPAADKVGTSLFSRGFETAETGTSLMVLGICQPDETTLLAEMLTEAVTWNLWPKLLAHKGEPAMTIQVLLDGIPVRDLDPAADRRLAPFITSMSAVRNVQDGLEPSGGLTTCQPIKVIRPNAQLGHLALTWHPHVASPTRDDDPLRELDDLAGIRPFQGPPRHTALMRQAELVVTYLEGPPPHIDNVCYGGVFRCLPDVDDAFASAEPPAHDEWQPAGIPNRTHRTYVNVGLRRIKEAVANFARGAVTAKPMGGNTPQVAATVVSAELADLVDHDVGDPTSSNGHGRKTQRRHGGRSGPRLTAHEPTIHTHRGRTYALVPIDLALSKPARVTCRTGIGYEGGTEKDVDGPRCVGYAPRSQNTPDDGMPVAWRAGDTLVVTPSDPDRWIAYIEVPASFTADISLHITDEPETP